MTWGENLKLPRKRNPILDRIFFADLPKIAHCYRIYNIYYSYVHHFSALDNKQTYQGVFN